ncbi:MAG: NAD-dependent epimerase/dehydratase family protein [Patulibacter sp.]|nr:NAD-dependent epimerase/dehydratase family protein [Patulibacter sp.]
MRVIVTGATGNVGTALVRALLRDPRIDEIVGIARRRPIWAPPRTRWIQADVARDDLRQHLAGADALVHLAWLIQPSRDRRITEAVNVEGSRRTFDAAVDAGVPTLVHASSVAAYSPADPQDPVDESWPTGGIPGSYYSEQKVAVERILDGVETAHPGLRTVRLRPGLIFQRSAAAELRRYFGGPLVPGWLARRSLIPAVPRMPVLAAQIVHADDIGDAYRLAVTAPGASGAYNVGAFPPLDAATLGHLLGARPVSLPPRVTRALIDLSWRARLHPVSPDWLDVGLGVPVMKTDRARTELGWSPRHGAEDVVLELLDGLRRGAGAGTPPLRPHAGGPLRIREFLSGVGGANALDRRSAEGPRPGAHRSARG